MKSIVYLGMFVLSGSVLAGINTVPPTGTGGPTAADFETSPPVYYSTPRPQGQNPEVQQDDYNSPEPTIDRDNG